ncbi:MAG: HAD family phosphatase [Myxococcales bacterium]|nr:MAG: HAD family phosphatase [Myxococcales bacterium]
MTPILLWDVMGTLVHDPFFEEMPEFFGVSFPDLLKTLKPGAWVDFELGQRTEPEFLNDFFADGRDFDHRGFVRTVRAAYRWLPGMEELLRELRDTGSSMHAFSNYPVWYRMIEERLGVSRFIDWSFVSCLTGMRKPDPAVYVHVLNQLGAPAERCVFIDDRNSNCEAARRAGIHAILFEGVAPLRESLRSAGAL